MNAYSVDFYVVTSLWIPLFVDHLVSETTLNSSLQYWKENENEKLSVRLTVLIVAVLWGRLSVYYGDKKSSHFLTVEKFLLFFMPTFQYKGCMKRGSFTLQPILIQIPFVWHKLKLRAKLWGIISLLNGIQLNLIYKLLILMTLSCSLNINSLKILSNIQRFLWGSIYSIYWHSWKGY